MVPGDELDDFHEHTKLRRVVWAVIAGMVIISLGIEAPRPADEKRGPGGVAPTFSLAYLGQEGRLSDSQLRGKPVVLNLWASWCGPCREEAKVFEAAYQRYKDQVHFVGVNVTDTPESARAFVKEFGITYPIVIDEGQTLAKALGYYGLPETYFIDENWRFTQTPPEGGVETGGGQGGPVVLGGLTKAELEKNIESLLDG